MPALMRLQPCIKTRPSPHHASPAARLRPNQPGPSDLRRPCVVARARLPGERRDEGGLGAFLSESEEQRLISFITYSGITGSAAVLGSRLAGSDLFASLQWRAERMDDFVWALLACMPLLLLDAVVLLPKYHSAPSESRQQAGQDSPGDTKQQQLRMLRSDLQAAGEATSGIRATSTLFQIVAAGVAEESLMSKPAQLSLELSYIWLRDFTSELLQRGLIVSCFAAWLQDRAFEAALDDVAFIAPNQLPVYTSDLALWIAGATMTLLVMPAVVSQANATSAAVASCAAFVAVQEEESDEKMDSWLLEWRMIEALAVQEKSLPAQAAFALTLIRGILRNCLLNAIFVTRGNLAASLVMAIVSDSLLFAYCELGRSRLPSLKAEQEPKK